MGMKEPMWLKWITSLYKTLRPGLERAFPFGCALIVVMQWVWSFGRDADARGIALGY